MRASLTSKPFEFLELPGELRNAIYSFAFPTLLSIFVHPHPSLDLPGVARPDCLGLLYANRQIYRESLGIFYSCNSFRLQSTSQLLQFLQVISPDARDNITSLSLRWSTDSDEDKVLRYRTEHQAFKLLRQCGSLENLDIEINEFELTVGYSLSLQHATDINQLQRVRGLKSLDVQNAGPGHFRDPSLKSWLAEQMLQPRESLDTEDQRLLDVVLDGVYEHQASEMSTWA
ncbi:MAG: hypothetical protein M1836_006859 [Candelina mexicana]|nr:MAG: hypothetical protein M1836_006859 [Candelina mexicana]